MLLLAHYDSVQTGPGAGDNGSGVVTLLETVRALRSGAALKNDVVFLFTDGEEDGGLGAQAFVDEHPWAKDVPVAVIVDSNGCGAVGLSVFDRHNGWLVREFAEAVRHPLAVSISDELGKLSGGAASGDHLSFYQKGVPALGLGAWGCQTAYHTVQDKLENIDLRTLQDLGNYAVPLIRKFGNLDLKRIQQDDLIYFPFLGCMIVYSAKWVLPLMAVTPAAPIAVVLLGVNRRYLTARGLTLSFLVWVIAVVAAGGLSAVVWWILQSLHAVNSSFTSAYNAQLYAIAFVALAAAVAWGMYASFRQKIGVQNLGAGALLLCGVLMLATYAFKPGATFLLAWPLLFASFALGCVFAWKRTESLPVRVVQLLCVLPAVALFLPFIGYLAIGTVEPAQNLVLIGILTTILIALLAPQVEVTMAHSKWLLPRACAVIALGFILLGALRSGYDPSHPKPDSISYWLDADAGKASWISFDDKPDDRTSQFLTSHAQTAKVDIFGSLGGDAVLKAAAPTLSSPLPVIKTVEDSTAGTERTLRLQISSPRQARVIWVILRNASVFRAELEGRNVQVGEMDTRNKLWGFIFVGLPLGGICLDVTVKASDTPRFIVTDQSDGLPEVPGVGVKPRGANRMPLPQVWPFFDAVTLVSRTFQIESNRSPSDHSAR